MKLIVQLTPVEILHLLNLLNDAEQKGEYYGNKEQYWKRNTRIVEKLKDPKPNDKTSKINNQNICQLEIDKTYKEWCGRDFMHLPLSEAVGKAIEQHIKNALQDVLTILEDKELAHKIFECWVESQDMRGAINAYRTTALGKIKEAIK